MPEPDFFGIRVDGALWLALRDFITAPQATLPAVSWRPRLPFPPSGRGNPEVLRQTKAAVLEALSPADREAPEAFFHTLRNREWPELSEQAAYALTVALEQIARFLDLCAVPRARNAPGTWTVFEARTNNLAELAVWFYVEWWSVGVRRWLEDALNDETTFRLYFEQPRESGK